MKPVLTARFFEKSESQPLPVYFSNGRYSSNPNAAFLKEEKELKPYSPAGGGTRETEKSGRREEARARSVMRTVGEYTDDDRVFVRRLFDGIAGEAEERVRRDRRRFYERALKDVPDIDVGDAHKYADRIVARLARRGRYGPAGAGQPQAGASGEEFRTLYDLAKVATELTQGDAASGSAASSQRTHQESEEEFYQWLRRAMSEGDGTDNSSGAPDSYNAGQQPDTRTSEEKTAEAIRGGIERRVSRYTPEDAGVMRNVYSGLGESAKARMEEDYNRFLERARTYAPTIGEDEWYKYADSMMAALARNKRYVGSPVDEAVASAVNGARRVVDRITGNGHRAEQARLALTGSRDLGYLLKPLLDRDYRGLKLSALCSGYVNEFVENPIKFAQIFDRIYMNRRTGMKMNWSGFSMKSETYS